METVLLQVVSRFQVNVPTLIADRPFIIGVILCMALLLLAGLAIVVLRLRTDRPGERLLDFEQRYRGWAILVPAILGPMAIGSGWMMLSVLFLNVLAYRDFSNALGIASDVQTEVSVIVSGALLFLGALLNLPILVLLALPVALGMLMVTHLTCGAERYLERVSKGALAFFICWFLLGQMALLANAVDFRNISFLLIFLLGMNDIAAYLGGQLLGRYRLAPKVSPSKTIEGALCGIVVSAVITTTFGAVVLPATYGALDLALLGIVLSVMGQAGDLIMSAIKRDLRLKDMGTGLPGMGGVLDRFDSLLLAAPLVCYAAYIR